MAVRKRVQMIAPFDELRGNVSGRQDLEYGNKNGKAWDSEQDVAYAKNYKPRYIVAKVSRTGKLYFQVKQRFAAINTAAARLMQALIGAAKVIFDILAKDLSFITTMQEDYLHAKDSGRATTYFSYWTGIIRDLLRSFGDHYEITPSLWIVNPWYNRGAYGQVASAVKYLTDWTIIVKFWKQLRQNGITFEVAGIGTGVSVSGLVFDDVIRGEAGVINPLELDVVQVDGVQRDFVGYPSGTHGFEADTFLMLGGEYITKEDAVHADGIYTLTDVAPTE